MRKKKKNLPRIHGTNPSFLPCFIPRTWRSFFKDLAIDLSELLHSAPYRAIHKFVKYPRFALSAPLPHLSPL